MVVVLWIDCGPFGPWTQLLAAVPDMGEARALADQADVRRPEKQERIDRKHPLYDVAMQHAGELLWRLDPDHLDNFEGVPWQVGAPAARRFLDAEASRFNAVRQAARERRHHRR